jgi:hypothetical protein
MQRGARYHAAGGFALLAFAASASGVALGRAGIGDALIYPLHGEECAAERNAVQLAALGALDAGGGKVPSTYGAGGAVRAIPGIEWWPLALAKESVAINGNYTNYYPA